MDKNRHFGPSWPDLPDHNLTITAGLQLAGFEDSEGIASIMVLTPRGGAQSVTVPVESSLCFGGQVLGRLSPDSAILGYYYEGTTTDRHFVLWSFAPGDGAFTKIGTACAFVLSPDQRWLIFGSGEVHTEAWGKLLDTDNLFAYSLVDGQVHQLTEGASANVFMEWR